MARDLGRARARASGGAGRSCGERTRTRALGTAAGMATFCNWTPGKRRPRPHLPRQDAAAPVAPVADCDELWRAWPRLAEVHRLHRPPFAPIAKKGPPAPPPSIFSEMSRARRRPEQGLDLRVWGPIGSDCSEQAAGPRVLSVFWEAGRNLLCLHLGPHRGSAREIMTSYELPTLRASPAASGCPRQRGLCSHSPRRLGLLAPNHHESPTFSRA